jgi:transposase InsO family protein
MDQRTQFIADSQREVFTVVELADRYGISRKTAYKWIDRYAEGGPPALLDHSRRPKSCPHETRTEIVEAILAVRRHHPTWGPKKLRHVLRKREPQVSWPARSTIADLLRRHGLITSPRRRPTPAHPGRPYTSMAAPNDTWTADFKGHFKTRNGLYCYPLTLVDGCSRYLLECQALRSTEIMLAKPVFLRAFHEYGLPGRIRTDNGVPFATTALGRLSVSVRPAHVS